MMNSISSNELRELVRDGLGIIPSRRDLELFGVPTAAGPNGQQMWEPKVTVAMLREIRANFTDEELESINNHQRGERTPDSLTRKVLAGLPGFGNCVAA